VTPAFVAEYLRILTLAITLSSSASLSGSYTDAECEKTPECRASGDMSGSLGVTLDLVKVGDALGVGATTTPFKGAISGFCECGGTCKLEGEVCGRLEVTFTIILLGFEVNVKKWTLVPESCL
jgi:hypothetical protein